MKHKGDLFPLILMLGYFIRSVFIAWLKSEKKMSEKEILKLDRKKIKKLWEEY